MKVIQKIQDSIKSNIKAVLDFDFTNIELDLPPDDKLGDYAFPCFDLAKELKSSPNDLATKLADNFKTDELIKEVKAAGPYLNISITPEFIKQALVEIGSTKQFGNSNSGKKKKILLEFSGPNTNKPQHVGHLRNNCIGQALVNIFRATGHKVIATNIINDRGIHIVKSMLMWKKFGKGETPQNSGIKGDHLVGKYYVMFGKLLKEEEDKYYQNIDVSKLDNLTRRKVADKFLAQSPLMQEARTMLKSWEDKDPEVRKIWKKMNNWVYEGYDKTYHDLGIKFDHLDFESDTYLLGRSIVDLGLKKKVFYKEEDGSIWIDLTKEGLDKKIVLRSDGTSVYLTQDLGTADRRFKKFKFDKSIYVVANEQDYHFKVLFATLKKLGFAWADNLHHLSYGMVDLPGGKIKSREGKTADADDLMTTTIAKAKEVMSKATKQVASDKEEVSKIVGLGALKFLMVGTNPQKNVTYDPDNSISFDGYTGTFIQYSHARIVNILNKADKLPKLNTLDFNIELNPEEQKLAKALLEFPKIIEQVTVSLNPSILTQYLFDLAKIFNNFYQNHSVLQAENENLKNIRLHLSLSTKNILKRGLELLGIQAPDSM